MADSSGNKHGTTTIHSEDSFQSVRPKFIPSQNATAIQITTPRKKIHMTALSTAQKVAQLRKGSANVRK